MPTPPPPPPPPLHLTPPAAAPGENVSPPPPSQAASSFGPEYASDPQFTMTDSSEELDTKEEDEEEEDSESINQSRRPFPPINHDPAAPHFLAGGQRQNHPAAARLPFDVRAPLVGARGNSRPGPPTQLVPPLGGAGNVGGGASVLGQPRGFGGFARPVNFPLRGNSGAARSGGMDFPIGRGGVINPPSQSSLIPPFNGAVHATESPVEVLENKSKNDATLEPRILPQKSFKYFAPPVTPEPIWQPTSEERMLLDLCGFSQMVAIADGVVAPTLHDVSANPNLQSVFPPLVSHMDCARRLLNGDDVDSGLVSREASGMELHDSETPESSQKGASNTSASNLSDYDDTRPPPPLKSKSQQSSQKCQTTSNGSSSPFKSASKPSSQTPLITPVEEAEARLAMTLVNAAAPAFESVFCRFAGKRATLADVDAAVGATVAWSAFPQRQGPSVYTFGESEACSVSKVNCEMEKKQDKDAQHFCSPLFG